MSDIMDISKNISTSSYELLSGTKSSHSSINAINSTSAILSNEAFSLIDTTQKANSSIEEIVKTNHLLLTKVKDGLTSSTEMETRASQMKLKVSSSLEKANITYSEKQEKILRAIEAGEINASLSEITSVMNEANNAMENQVSLSNGLEKSVEKFKL